MPLSFPPAGLPVPLTLPDPVYGVPRRSSSVVSSPTASSSATAAELPPPATMGGKSSSGLMRRISRGARFPRRRGSANHSHRDQSAGPTVFRRKSENRGIGDSSNVEISDFELEDRDDEVVDDVIDLPGHDRAATAAAPAGLGIYSGRPNVGSAPPPLGGGVAPTRQSILERGTFLTKVSKKRQKTMKFRLDQDSAKVTWESSRTPKHFYIDDVREIRVGAQARNYREEFGLGPAVEPLWFTVIYLGPSRGRSRNLKALHLLAPDAYVFQLWTKSLDSVSRSRIDLMAGLVGTAERSARILWRREMDKKLGAGPARAPEDERVDLADVMAICRKLHINCTEASLRDNFARADGDGNGYLDELEFVDFVTRMKERRDIRAIYQRYLPEGGSELDRTAFFDFLRDSQNVDVDADPEQWAAVFERAAAVRPSKSKGEPPQATEAIAAATETTTTTPSAATTMSAAAFQHYLTSPQNSAIAAGPPPSSRLDRPLNEYFVSSSHNTYLLGRQVAGESSTEAYISALQKGCRCIEIDCWNGGDGKPEVVHGRTLTSSVPFLDCVKVIAKYAFVSSPYPLIISLEVHCDAEQQRVMTDIMKAEFGDRLVLRPLEDHHGTLPSPEELRGKILIKVKAPMEAAAEERALPPQLAPPVAGGEAPPRGRRQRSLSSPWSRPVALDNSTVPNSPLLPSPPSMSPAERPGALWSSPRTSTTSSLATHATLVSSAEDSDSPPPSLSDGRRRRRARTSGITRVLGELGVYTQGIKFASFHAHEARSYNHVFSINENTLEKLSKPSSGAKELLDAHNVHHLMRVYPSQSRVFSSNFDPMRAWRRGVQMAALNWQTYDLGLQINDAMFAAGSDRSGYVLKPEELRGGGGGGGCDTAAAEKTAAGPAPLYQPRRKTKKLVQFAVDIVSAQQLPRPVGLSPDANINPYVEFEMFCAEDKSRGIATGQGGHDASARNGVSGIGSPLRKRTRIVEGNGYDPSWNETLTLTLQTKYPSLVFVRWTVWNSADGRALSASGAPLASFTAKLSSLRQGYRHIPLYDAQGEQYLFSSLFCKIKKEDHVAIEENGAFPASISAAASFSAASASPSFSDSATLVSAGGNSPPLDPVRTSACCVPMPSSSGAGAGGGGSVSGSGSNNGSSAGGRGNFLRRAFSRSNSQRKRAAKRELQASSSFDGSDFSRTSTFEK